MRFIGDGRALTWGNFSEKDQLGGSENRGFLRTVRIGRISLWVLGHIKEWIQD